MNRSQIIRGCGFAALWLVAGHVYAGRVSPPKVATVSEVPDDGAEELELAPRPTAPKDFDEAIAAMQTGTSAERLSVLKRKAKRDLVRFPAGSFVMGDFGRLWNPSKLYYFNFKDDKPTHKVKLSAFSMSKFKVTFAEYDLFAEATGRPLPAASGREENVYRYPNVPVRASWADAQAYCKWLGTQLGMDMSLPTEAEWEYAARSGGQFFAAATDDGNIDYRRNMPYLAISTYFKPANKPDYFDGYSAGLYPPNPSGMHQMYINGTEWAQDWYDPDYYSKSPKTNPQGPNTGTYRVIRGQDQLGMGEIGFTFARGFAPPDAETERASRPNRELDGLFSYGYRHQNAIRCVSHP